MTLEQQFVKAVKSRNRALAEQCVQAMLQRKMAAALVTEKMRVGANMLREAYCVVYRTGGTANYQWRRTLAMSKAEAEKALASVTRAGYKAHIEDYDRSMSIGLPDTYGLDEGTTGPTRMQVQNEYDKQRSVGKSERAAVRETERILGVKDVRLSSDGKTVSYFTESTYDPPTNWDKGFQWPIRIAGGGTETPFLKNGTWYLRVWDAKAKKHYTYNYSTDMMELDEAASVRRSTAVVLNETVTYCGLCDKPVMQGNKPVGDIVDHFVYDSLGDLDYIELFHRACAVKKNWRIDAQGHVVGTKRGRLAEAVIVGDDMPAKEVQRVFDEHGDLVATEKLCGIKRLRVSENGDVLSYMRESRDLREARDIPILAEDATHDRLNRRIEVLYKSLYDRDEMPTWRARKLEAELAQAKKDLADYMRRVPEFGTLQWGKKIFIGTKQLAWTDETTYHVPVKGKVNLNAINQALYKRFHAPSIGKFGGGTDVRAVRDLGNGMVEVVVVYSIGD